MVHHLSVVPRATAKELWALAWRKRRRYRVTGMSMSPTLLPGAFVLAAPGASFASGDVVVALDPRTGQPVVKRVSDVGPGGVFLRGDNPARSTDSRTYGPVRPEAVLARVTSQF